MSKRAPTPPSIIETFRLRLRPPRSEDAEIIFSSYASDPEVSRYLSWSPHRSVEDARVFLESAIDAWQAGSIYQWVITKAAADIPIGMISVILDEHGAMLGYVLARSEWGKGFCTEAAQALVDRAFNEWGVYRVWAYCDVDNPASARVMEKVGMTREGILRRFALHPNVSPEPRDVLVYAKVR